MAQWLEYSLETTSASLDALTARLTANGLTGLVVEDEEDFKRFLEENRQYWDYVDEELQARMKGAARVKFYVTNDNCGEKEAEGYLKGIEGVTVLKTPMEEEDWANGWKKYYQPMEIGKRLYVVPEWLDHTAPDGRVSLILNPGLTFGTGSHPTTQICMEGVEKYTKSGDRVLDLGCGSGILSIAAVKLGAAQALGVDIDPKAPDVAYENAALNGISRENYTVLAGDVLSDGKFRQAITGEGWDLILANIVSDVIIPLSGFVGTMLRSGGKFLCSGIIDTRAEEVRAALEKNGFRILETRSRKGWFAYECSYEG